MSYKNKSRKSKAKKMYRRKRRNNTGITGVVKSNTIVKHRYYTGNIGTTTSTLVGQYEFRASSVYDPDYTASMGDHQPMGHDQMATLYSRYRVVGLGVKVTFTNLTASSHSTVGIIPLRSGQIASPPTNLTACVEQQGAIVRSVGYDDDVTLRLYFRPWQIEGITKNKYMNDSIYSALVGSNPGSQPCILLFWQNMDGSTSTGHNITVELTYYTLWDIPLQLSTS